MTALSRDEEARERGRPERAARPVTMAQVARAAGVSLKTVSRVVNGEPNVSEATAGKVGEAIARLGFRPNEIARSLATGATRSLALVLPNISNPFYAGLLEGVQARADACGYSVLLGNSVRSGARAHQFLTVLRAGRVDGAIVVGLEADALAAIAGDVAGLPLVLVDSGRARGADVEIGFDHRRSARVATEHLVALGHRRIACVNGPPALRVSVERLGGYREALGAACIGWREELVASGDYTERGGYRATEALLERGLGAFSGLFAANDLMAVGALAACRDRGVAVPGAISIVGLDDISLAAYVSPALTTVRLPTREVGATAARRLVEMIESPRRPPPGPIAMAGTLIVRRSTAPPPGP